MMIVRDTLRGAEEAIYSLSRLYRIFQAKGSLSDGTLERPKWRRRRNTSYSYECRNSQAKIQRSMNDDCVIRILFLIVYIDVSN